LQKIQTKNLILCCPARAFNYEKTKELKKNELSKATIKKIKIKSNEQKSNKASLIFEKYPIF
jgi:hypothetical protein